MLSRRQSKFVSCRRKRHHTVSLPLIIGLFSVGALLIILAFVLRDDESETPEVPVDRRITAHASARTDASFDSSGSHAGSALPEAVTPRAGRSRRGTPSGTQTRKQAPVPRRRDTGTVRSPAPDADAAMAAFARLPVDRGAVAPGIGHYRIVDAAITYGKDATPEEIMRAQATNYVVVSGDILGRIAQKHGCSIEQIQRANHLTGDQIRIGQKLLIPNCGDADSSASRTSDAASAVPRGRWWKQSGVDTKTLPKLMAEEGFRAPAKFMALVLEFTFDGSHGVITRERAFDYRGTSSTNSGWNPGTSVWPFAAVAALRRIDELGFTSRTDVTFHGKRKYRTTVGKLIGDAIARGDEIAGHRIVQLASFDKLHDEILTSRFGITRTALNRVGQPGMRESPGGDASLRIAPAITLTEGRKTVSLPAARSSARAVCNAAACTSLQDLGESVRRIMLQEHLPEDESFGISPSELPVLQRAMCGEGISRGTGIVDRFRSAFRDSRVRFCSRPAFSEDWYTDSLYIFDPRFNQAWIIVMSGYPGQNALDSAAAAIAKIISSGKLRKIP